jgi:hypothetical protein
MLRLKSLLMGTAMSVLAASGALAAGNQVYIDQVGNNSNISVTQSGGDNAVGDSAAAAILHGNNQSITVSQIGAVNTAALNVQGAGTTVQSTVTGNTNTVNIDCGSGSVNKASACADSNITANITGSNNDIGINAGSKSTHSTEVTGDRNTLHTDSITSNLLGARSTITATGSDNAVTVTQHGPAGLNGFEATVALTGSSNTVGVAQSGTVDSKVNITSVGSNNTISVISGN